ncbi:MAG: MoxR family ATPase [Gemmatimonadota bacterium]|nr:MAG: MoxR family ATPase [Gemmatimonadota bacterium]
MADEAKLKEKPTKRKSQKAAEPVVSSSGLELSEVIVGQVRKRIVGQEGMVERILIGLLTGGHVLLEGVPGLAKTLAVRTVAETINTRFQRIQFTPDLLPADLIGTMIYNQKTGDFEPRQGPIFANIILADEVNRAPAKVQSALLEAMQEKQVTFGGQTFGLEEPFLVLATQNPIEQEGTYPLPEAQVDRFMLKVKIGYPSRDEEKEIMRRMASGDPIAVEVVTEPGAIMQARRDIAELYIDDKVADYIVDLVQATRQPADYGLPELVPLIEYGASPRASIYLAQTGRAHAYLRGRAYVIPDDVKAMAPDVFRHRIITTYEAEAEEVTSDEITRRVLETVEVP